MKPGVFIGADCAYNKLCARHTHARLTASACTIDSERTDLFKECPPNREACSRIVLKDSRRGIPMFKAERLA